MAPKYVCILFPRTHDYALSHTKRELKLRLELRLLISRPWDREQILGYSRGASVLSKLLKVVETGKFLCFPFHSFSFTCKWNWWKCLIFTFIPETQHNKILPHDGDNFYVYTCNSRRKPKHMMCCQILCCTRTNVWVCVRVSRQLCGAYPAISVRRTSLQLRAFYLPSLPCSACLSSAD